jgi:two-component system, OmpR family, response regulator
VKRILYVEDEQDIQVIARIALEDVGGFEVDVASSGREALGQAEAFAPDLILLDVMMPGMDGPATLRGLRGKPSLASVPVIFMTAKVQSNEVDEYMRMGAIGVVRKPFDPLTLAAEVTRLVESRAA